MTLTTPPRRPTSCSVKRQSWLTWRQWRNAAPCTGRGRGCVSRSEIQIMATMRGAALALAAVLVLTATASAADDDLRAKALKLNDITGDDAVNAKVRELLKNPEGTKKLLDVALKMAKEKEQPFNVNAT